LGTNSTAECIVWGAITGNEALKYIEEAENSSPKMQDVVKDELARLDNLMSKKGKENIYDIRRELRRTMDEYLGVFRNKEGMERALEKIKELKERFKDIEIKDKSKVYNTEFINALELENMLMVSEVVALSALERKESRGAHARTDFPKRDDKNFLKHTIATKDGEKIKISYIPVKITRWKPVERKY
jgi:succinate dehydrogenase / fumarate reductase flavoprotein subunit